MLALISWQKARSYQFTYMLRRKVSRNKTSTGGFGKRRYLKRTTRLRKSWSSASVSSMKKPKRTKEKSISKLIKEADRLFSIEVRSLISAKQILEQPYSMPDSRSCFTCGRWYPIKKLHCGHYLSRYYKAARWNYDNARPQCMMCNMWKRGDPVVFRRNLINEIGEARVLAVEALRDAPIKLTREYLESLIASFSSNE